MTMTTNWKGWSEGEKKKRNTALLFRERNWEIHNNPMQHADLLPEVSRVVHFCDTVNEAHPRFNEEYCHVWSRLQNMRTCPACKEVMPDSVQTLWTLQNFDVEFTQELREYVMSPHLVNR